MFKFYIGSCLFCLISLIIGTLRTYCVQIRNGYTKKRFSKLEKIVVIIRSLILCIIPLVNIFYGIAFLSVGIFLNDEDILKKINT